MVGALVKLVPLVLTLDTFRVSCTSPLLQGRHSLGSDNQSGRCLRHRRDPRVKCAVFTIDMGLCQVILGMVMYGSNSAFAGCCSAGSSK